MPASAVRTALGIDIGGSCSRVAVVTAAGTIRQLGEIPTPPGGDPDTLARELARITEGLAPPHTPVGVALPGIWERDTTVMHRALNLPRLEGVNVRQFFETALHRPVVLETDVNAAALGQYHHMGDSPARFAYLSLGTGAGGAVMLDGQLLRHTRGGAGHFGHLIVDTSPTAPRCRCGARGCLEAILREAPPSNVAGALAIALLQTANIYAPTVIALGGGVIDNHAELVPQTADEFHRLGCKLPAPDLRIEAAPLPTNQAGVIGAALLALQFPSE